MKAVAEMVPYFFSMDRINYSGYVGNRLVLIIFFHIFQIGCISTNEQYPKLDILKLNLRVIATRIRGLIFLGFVRIYSPLLRNNAFCLRLNFNISNLLRDLLFIPSGERVCSNV